MESGITMSLTNSASPKHFFNAFRAALYDCDASKLQAQLGELFAPDSKIHLAHPLGSMTGPDELFAVGYGPLLEAIPDLERRDFIVVGDGGKAGWIGCGGYYTGVFERPWLKIPATRHIVTMHYVEYFRVEDDRIVEMYALWDIPEVLMQARAWPMSPSLGREMKWPGPATHDGIVVGDYDEGRSTASLDLVNAMLLGLGKHAAEGAEAMGLENYWHPRMNWYGPSGIGSNRRISGFRNWHQIPFLDAMPDRMGRLAEGGQVAYFADGDYVAYCGWPGLDATVSGDGWLGIAASGQEITLCSLDFWRCENGRIRENWVMVDILDVYHQLGVDVLARMEALTVDRQLNPPGL